MITINNYYSVPPEIMTQIQDLTELVNELVEKSNTSAEILTGLPALIKAEAEQSQAGITDLKSVITDLETKLGQQQPVPAEDLSEMIIKLRGVNDVTTSTNAGLSALADSISQIIPDVTAPPVEPVPVEPTPVEPIPTPPIETPLEEPVA